MAENSELLASIESYKAQLQQVEAALMIDDENEELKKLKTDLEEVIALTNDLLGTKAPTKAPKEEAIEQTDDKVNELLGTAGIGNSSTQPTEDTFCQWKQGDKCQAAWSKDNRYYDAVVLSFNEDPTMCNVKFEVYDQIEAVKIASLQSRDASNGKRKFGETQDGKPVKLSKDEIEKKREQRKKKLVKKRQRLKEIEDQREKEKGNWQTFYSGKGKSKSKVRGLNKKSIFATPDSSLGKVGIGTCGIGGKGMTKYESPAQYIYKK